MQRQPVSRSLSSFLLGALVVGAAACASVFGFESLQDAVDSGAVAEDRDAGDGGILPPPLGVCPLDLPGAPPDDNLPNVETELTFALDRVGLAPDAGLNLDSRCTTSPEESACIVADGGSLVGKPWLDGPAGIDVTGNLLLAAIDDFFPAMRESNLQNAIAAGFGNLLFRVQGWNGTANDSSVALVVYASRGLQGTGGGIERRIPDPEAAGEPWTYSQKAVGLGQVSNHRFVLTFTEPVPFVLPTQIAPARLPEVGSPVDEDAGTRGAANERPLTLLVAAAYILFDLLPQDAGTYRIENGVLAGRVSLDNFFAEASRIRDVDDESSQAFCIGGARTVQLISTQLCAASDIFASPGRESTAAASARCDAVSIGIAFAARRAAIGAEILPGAGDDPCPGSPRQLACDTDADAGPDADADAGPDAAPMP